ncbi:RagB/SusD family nutrient uptake outer membrane protein [uncultured Aquimarina sp.]|uniref:RagB/SusD family nutrient uptake outer membrane protein n=1 Tax=uncultured Aquimarina sp. TaxID=575652 RepID=UPI0026087C80|nr:RagB/SusD family nutrient uptake outer membrane protein [uncultured Aquimarina sp.]
MKNKIFFLIVFVFAVFGCKNDDDVQVRTGDIKITVLTESNAIFSGAIVKILPNDIEKITNESGEVFFEDLSEGTYTIIVSVPGDTINEEFVIEPDQLNLLTIIVDDITVIEPDPLDINFLINTIYARLKDDTLFDSGGYSMYWGDIGVDVVSTNTTVSSNYRDLDKFELSPTNTIINDVWVSHYETIIEANTGIEFLESIDPISNPEIDKELLTGELRFLRALLYFNLVKLYGNPVLTTSGNNIDINNPPVFIQDTEQVYDLIIADLEYAQENLVVSGPNNRASVAAAEALLGKVYIQMAGFPLFQTDKYQKALEQFEKLRGRFNLEPNYEDVFDVLNEVNNSEIIFSIDFSADNPNEGSNYGVLWGPLGLAIEDNLILVPSFVENYFEGPINFPINTNDQRFNQNIATFTVQNGIATNTEDIANWRPYKFKKDVSSPVIRNGESFDFPYLRYADILLLLAEAENAINGPTPAAYDAINTVRRRAFGSVDYELAEGLNQEEFLDAILNERQLELCFEGHRKDDLIRTQKLESTINSFNIDNPENIKDFQSHEFIWPIPQIEIDLNPNTIQNPGY